MRASRVVSRRRDELIDKSNLHKANSGCMCPELGEFIQRSRLVDRSSRTERCSSQSVVETVSFPQTANADNLTDLSRGSMAQAIPGGLIQCKKQHPRAQHPS